MSPDEITPPPVDIQLEEVSNAIQRAAADLLSARLVLDRERAEFVARGAEPSRPLLLAATRVVDDLRRIEEALAGLLQQLEARGAPTP
jgi:hypothetical protein